jgi:hypothetical protein
MLLGIAALGPGESVVSLRVFSVATGQALVEGTELVGRGQALQVTAANLAERVLADPVLSSIPKPRILAAATKSRVLVTASVAPQARWLTWMGVGLIGLATVVECGLLVAGTIGWFGAAENEAARVGAVSPLVVIGTSTLGLYALGFVAVLVDPWLPSGADATTRDRS